MPDYEPPTTDDLPHDPHDGRPSLDDAPARVGRYRILEPLGEGGFGVVYRAEQAEPVRRQVALKVIKPGMDSKAVVSRFEAERQALALMDHPCVAKIYDGGVTDEGRPYFAMELVKGEPITTHCDRQRLGVRARIELFIRVCEAIQHAHHKGVVHRDLKPSNILVEYESGKATPKVIDFGVAKALHQRLTEATIFTGQGQMIGTPEYMSPEQAEMSGADIDTRSDVYSLGVLLYELLTGVRPFDSESLRQAALAEIQRIIREVDPPKPSTRLSTAAEAESVAASRNTEVRSLSGVLRRDLDWVCMKCLEKDRERRYDTANALAEDLRRFLSDEPVAAGPPSASYRLRKFVRRNRSGVLATGAVVAVAVTGAVVASVGWSRALDGQRQAKDALVDLVRESLRDGWDDPVLRDRMDRAGLDIALSEENGERRFFVDVEGSDSIPRLAGFTREVYGWLEESERLASAEAERAAAAEAEAKERAEQLQIVADFQAEQLGAIDAAKMGLDLRNTLVDLYADRLERGGLPEDEAAAQAEALDASLSGVDFTGLALGSLEANVFVPALDAIDRQFEDQPLVRAQLQQTLAIVLRDAGLLEAAEEPQRAALEGYRRVLGDEHRDTLGSISNMGFLLRAKGKFTEAEPYYREALEGYRRVLGDEHRDTLGSISHMGFLLRAKGKFTEAEPYYREALEAHRR
ncbi:MAG: serine/threonine-protein kinase, partial [Planctomycetota bacterium]